MLTCAASLASRARMIRRLERYEILEEIGHGGMATVYRARDTKLDRLVALKLMHPHLRGAAEARARFRREAQSVARLKHPRILEIYDYSGEESEESYIATELLTGPTLKAFVESGVEMPAEVAACFGIEIARALAAAHDKGIVHRDVKPENILLHENRCIKLTDFGIADMVDAQSMTATGQILGSPGHMAPEQIEGQPTDARTDLFALGTVLYYLAVGRLPFTGKSPHQVLKRVLDGDFPDPLRIRPAIGGRMKAILVRAMANSPNDRYQSASEFEAALRTYVGEIGIDDAEREVERFLADPASVREAIHRRIVARETERGRCALADRRTQDASDAFARVLAIDERNPEVLDLVSRMGRERERSLAIRRLSMGAGVLALAAVVGWVAAAPSATDVAAPPIAVPGPEDAGARDDRSPDAPSDEPSASTDASMPTDGTSAISALPDAPREFALELRPIRRDPQPVVRLRRVVFSPDPQNVTIAVDDQPARPYGPSFESVELSPGRHRFRFETDLDCCADLTVERDIPAGDEPLVLSVVLPSQPAILIVSSNVPADVTVERIARGRARMPIDVPIVSRTRSELRAITVTAPGHRAYTGEVQLTAGAVTTTDVVLQPLPEDGRDSPAAGGGE